MSGGGPNAREAKKIIERKRTYTVAVVCAAIEEKVPDLALQEDIKWVAKEEINALAKLAGDLLDTLVDESTTLNALFLEAVTGTNDRIDALLEQIGASNHIGPAGA